MQSADRRVPSLGGCKSAGQLDEGVYGGTTLGGQFLVRPCSGRSRILERGVLLQAAEGSRTEARSANQSARSAENFFAFIFQLSGWALVAPSCFARQVPDVKGLQDPGPPCASVSC